MSLNKKNMGNDKELLLFNAAGMLTSIANLISVNAGKIVVALHRGYKEQRGMPGICTWNDFYDEIKFCEASEALKLLKEKNTDSKLPWAVVSHESYLLASDRTVGFKFLIDEYCIENNIWNMEFDRCFIQCTDEINDFDYVKGYIRYLYELQANSGCRLDFIEMQAALNYFLNKEKGIVKVRKPNIDNGEDKP